MSIIRRLACAAAFAASLGGCSIVDQFSPRAVDYNIEAEHAQLQGLLLNVVRASLNRPMQFTTLSTVTGTASISGSGNLLVPFGHHRPAAVATPDQLTLSSTVSGGPTFTVPVLDTQEFYRGELTPLSGQEYHFFLNAGYTAPVLLYLFVDSIELKTMGPSPQTFLFRNSAGSDFDFDQFAAVADYLLSLGLSMEEVNKTETIGPEITAASLHSLHEIAEATNAGIKISPVPAAGQAAGSPISPARQKKPAAAATGRYTLQKERKFYRPCFQPLSGTTTAQIDAALSCGGEKGGDESGDASALTRAGGFTAPGLAAELERIRRVFIERGQARPATAAKLATLPNLPADARLQLRLYTRSTEAILHYLGTLVDRHLHPGFDRPRVIQAKVGEPYLPYPQIACPYTAVPIPSAFIAPGYRCENMFVVVTGSSAPSALSIEYDGRVYSIPADPQISGRTLRLLDIVKQLLALHTSAKELPASNVLNVIGSP